MENEHYQDDNPIREPPTTTGKYLRRITAPFRILTDTFLWHWKDVGSPLRKVIPGRPPRPQPTPLERLQRCILEKRYSEALELANKHHLDTEDIFKAQWLDSDISEDSIRNFLAKVNDRTWVLANCANCVAKEPKSTRLLYRYGLKQTESIFWKDVEQEIESVLRSSSETSDQDQNIGDRSSKSPSTADLCIYRAQFLKYLDRLETHDAIYVGACDIDGGMSDGSTFFEHFTWFRDCDLIEQAVNLARFEEIAALEQLFTRHGQEVLPFRLGILSSLPETADPTTYKHLLPLVDTRSQLEIEWQVIPWRRADWTESDAVKDFLGLVDGPDSDNSQTSTFSVKNEYPASASTISQWYYDRCIDIEKTSGQVDLALDFVHLGIQNHATGLEDLQEDLHTLSMLVYDCFGASSKLSTEICLDDIRDLTPNEMVSLMATEATNETIVPIIRDFALPYLKRSMGHQMPEHSKAESLLHEWIQAIASDHLDWCVAILEASTTSSPNDQRVITAPVDVTEVALACAYKCLHASQLPLLRRLIACIPPASEYLKTSASFVTNNHHRSSEIQPEFNASDGSIPLDSLARGNSNDSIKLERRVQRLRSHVDAVLILDRYNLYKPLAWFLEADGNLELQRQLLITLARQSYGEDVLDASSEERFENDDEWQGLLENMLTLQKLGVLGSLSRWQICGEFLSVALSCGRFDLCKEIIQPIRGLPPVPLDLAETLVLDAADEFYDNADSGDMTGGFLKKANDCLKILSPTPAIQSRLDLIQATHHLTVRYNVTYEADGNLPILPIQIRLCPDRMELIAQVLKNEPDAFMSPQTIVDLSKKLLGESYDNVAKVRVQVMIADMAIEKECYPAAYTICKELLLDAEAASDPSITGMTCELCLKLGNAKQWPDLGKRMELVAFTLSHGTPESVLSTLSLWRTLECERLISNILKYPTTQARHDMTRTSHSELLQETTGDFDKSIIALHRQHAAIVSGLKADPEQALGKLTLPIFHQSVESVLSTDPRTQTDDDEQTELRNRALEVAMHLKQVTNCLGIERGTADRLVSVNDNDLIDLARDSWRHNTCQSFHYLMHVDDDSSVMSYVEDLARSPANENIICLLFALKALFYVFQTEPTRILALAKCSPVAVLANLPVIASIVAAIPADTNGKAEAAQAVQAAQHYHRLTASRRQEETVRSLYERDGIIAHMFQTDPEYRFRAITQMACTFDKSQLSRAMTLATEFGIPHSDVLLARVPWLLSAEKVQPETLKIQLAGHEDFLKNYSDDLIPPLQNMLDAVGLRPHESQVQFLEIFSACLENAGNQSTAQRVLAERVRDRLNLLNRLRGLPALANLKLDIIARSDRLEEVVESLAKFKSEGELHDLKAVLPEILLLESLDVSDRQRIHQSRPYDSHTVLSRLYFQVALEHISDVSWEYMDERSLDRTLSGIKGILSHLTAPDLLVLVRQLTIEETAMGIPISYRNDFAEYGCELVEAQELASNAPRQELFTIRRHTQHVLRLSNIEDEHGYRIPTERVLQFEAAFLKDAKAAAAVCMRTIIAGANFAFIEKICHILCEFYGDVDLFDTARLYEEVTSCILGQSSDPAYDNVFRKGIDSPMAALERIAASGPPYAMPIDHGPQHSNADLNEVEHRSAEDLYIKETDRGHISSNQSLNDTISATASTSQNSIPKWAPDATQFPAELPSSKSQDSLPQSGFILPSDGWDIGDLEFDLPITSTIASAPPPPLSTTNLENQTGWDLDFSPSTEQLLRMPVVSTSHESLTSVPEGFWDLDISAELFTVS
ncbi:secretory pathway protein Sec39-domain-containing protein [Phlyctochytrium arcticum]|nr:secretory pathway protein Sec39-domain-containing protein [Phlyctochytrium arcticum]